MIPPQFRPDAGCSQVGAAASVYDVAWDECPLIFGWRALMGSRWTSDGPERAGPCGPFPPGTSDDLDDGLGIWRLVVTPYPSFMAYARAHAYSMAMRTAMQMRAHMCTRDWTTQRSRSRRCCANATFWPRARLAGWAPLRAPHGLGRPLPPAGPADPRAGPAPPMRGSEGVLRPCDGTPQYRALVTARQNDTTAAPL